MKQCVPISQLIADKYGIAAIIIQWFINNN
jgi:hypothetical protein